uniref:Uncharacterized protein n=1 Tax=Vibrio genomosp. F6 TaxID=723172 RepID=A0A0H3ZLB4_9VIBR|nr:hypothetical protein [Vibrio genomosp. F6]
MQGWGNYEGIRQRPIKLQTNANPNLKQRADYTQTVWN